TPPQHPPIGSGTLYPNDGFQHLFRRSFRTSLPAAPDPKRPARAHIRAPRGLPRSLMHKVVRHGRNVLLTRAHNFTYRLSVGCPPREDTMLDPEKSAHTQQSL